MILCPLHHWSDEDGPICRCCQTEIAQILQVAQDAYTRENEALRLKINPFTDTAAATTLNGYDLPTQPTLFEGWRGIACGFIFAAIVQLLIVFALWLRS